MKSSIITKINIFLKGKRQCSYSFEKSEPEEITAHSESFERCILCGKETSVPIFMPIEQRENYEVGCGQICTLCARELYGSLEKEHMLTEAQILLAIEQSRKEIENK
ncbi:MAG: hypothetical protein IJN34_03930 [Clostridia bacterium]|nr:hypothetical protein [Clostridia bacterium]